MNVIGSRPDGWWRDRTGAMARLVERVGAWAGDRDVVVVLDGRPRELGPAGAEVVWAPGGRDAADDEIVRLVEAAGGGEPVEVVTSDRALAARVEALGARVVSSGTFLRALDGS